MSRPLESDLRAHAEARLDAGAQDMRPADQVMRLSRLGASFPTRLSFMRRLIRALASEGAQVTRPVWQIDASGFGHAVYEVPLGGHTYSLIAYANAIPDDARTDRVIATVWDASFALFDGRPSADDIARLSLHVPRQEAGRMRETELILSRANKSVRLFAHVVERLAQGQQPDPDRIAETGYLMRTTAVYGNGKFGIADRARIADRPVLDGAFAAEMLTVWLIRAFSLDLVEHVAAANGGAQAVRLAAPLRRHLGIGNSTGLGMAPFLVNHPELLHAWINAREQALARVRALRHPSAEARAHLHALIRRARDHVTQWQVDDAVQAHRIEVLRAELAGLTLPEGPFPIAHLLDAAQTLSVETQELLCALVLEPFGDLIDDLAETMSPALPSPFRATQTVAEARADLAAYDWALAVDFADPEAQRMFWYVSADKLEPRFGDATTTAGVERASPLDIARQVQGWAEALRHARPDAPLAEVLIARPQHRAIAARVQNLASLRYAEIRDNLIDAATRPIDMLRAKLAVFGASKFDPKSDRWTRVTLFQGAPGPDELRHAGVDDWAFPILDTAERP